MVENSHLVVDDLYKNTLAHIVFLMTKFGVILLYIVFMCIFIYIICNMYMSKDPNVKKSKKKHLLALFVSWIVISLYAFTYMNKHSLF